MNRDSSSLDARLRWAATLLVGSPSTVAAAAFAHGHGALSLAAFLAVLCVCIAAGAASARALLRHVKRPSPLATRPVAAAPQS
jgi:hypothetical protein